MSSGDVARAVRNLEKSGVVIADAYHELNHWQEPTAAMKTAQTSFDFAEQWLSRGSGVVAYPEALA